LLDEKKGKGKGRVDRCACVDGGGWVEGGALVADGWAMGDGRLYFVDFSSGSWVTR
jgi:hypothetical protein